MLAGSSLRSAIAEAQARLERAKILATARMDAELLLMYAIKKPRAFLLANPDYVLSDEELQRFQRSLSRRELHEPIQYITGEVEFYGLSLFVDSRVLIPRPETEHLVESVLERTAIDAPLRIVDVGTGSGAIAIAIATHRSHTRITALDISQDALDLATPNAKNHGVADRIRFLASDLLSAVEKEQFDVVVSNPPYIANGDGPSLSRQVREHEPAVALYAGDSGLEIYERLIPQTSRILKPGGWLALEIGFGQQDALSRLLAEWDEVSFIPDLQGIPRVACARLPK
jgi:release factor glutamine methyltransferase